MLGAAPPCCLVHVCPRHEERPAPSSFVTPMRSREKLSNFASILKNERERFSFRKSISIYGVLMTPALSFSRREDCARDQKDLLGAIQYELQYKISYLVSFAGGDRTNSQYCELKRACDWVPYQELCSCGLFTVFIRLGFWASKMQTQPQRFKSGTRLAL